jgi:rubrerythrin
MALQVDFSLLDAQDVLDIAIQVEQEAEDNYEQIAGWADSDGNAEVAAFFKRMAGFEAKHREQLTAQRKAKFGDAPSKHSDAAIWEVEQPDYEAISKAVTLEEAFELAMDAERRAGNYYQGALEYVSDPEVAKLFEELRTSEDDHLRMLRQQRERLFGSHQNE